MGRTALVALFAMCSHHAGAAWAKTGVRAPAVYARLRSAALPMSMRVALDAGGGGVGAGGGGEGSGRGRRDDDGEGEGEFERLPVGWPFIVPLLHAVNKGLLCASVAPDRRDFAARATDVGFLGFLGAYAALASFGPFALAPLQFALVQVGLGHMLLESLVNGIVLPFFRDPAKGAHSRSLRPDIWLHHAFAITAFSACLAFRVFIPQAVILTATECTAGLPPAFQEARKASRATGALSATLAALMLAGFAGRCALSLAVVLPQAPQTLGALAQLVGGTAARPAHAAARGTVWACAVGLGSLNCLWFGKVVAAVSRSVGGSGWARAPGAAPAPAS